MFNSNPSKGMQEWAQKGEMQEQEHRNILSTALPNISAHHLQPSANQESWTAPSVQDKEAANQGGGKYGQNPEAQQGKLLPPPGTV